MTRRLEEFKEWWKEHDMEHITFSGAAKAGWREGWTRGHSQATAETEPVLAKLRKEIDQLRQQLADRDERLQKLVKCAREFSANVPIQLFIQCQEFQAARQACK